jgi:hypothetical protein
MASTISFTISNLAKSRVNKLRQRAKRMGLTQDAYVRELIEEDEELDKLVRSKTFAELAEPFRQALAGASEADLDALARPAKHKGKR